MAHLEIKKNGKLIKRLKASERDKKGDYIFRLDGGRTVSIPPDETVKKGNIEFRIIGGMTPVQIAKPVKVPSKKVRDIQPGKSTQQDLERQYDIEQFYKSREPHKLFSIKPVGCFEPDNLHNKNILGSLIFTDKGICFISNDEITGNQRKGSSARDWGSMATFLTAGPLGKLIFDAATDTGESWQKTLSIERAKMVKFETKYSLRKILEYSKGLLIFNHNNIVKMGIPGFFNRRLISIYTSERKVRFSTYENLHRMKIDRLKSYGTSLGIKVFTHISIRTLIFTIFLIAFILFLIVVIAVKSW